MAVRLRKLFLFIFSCCISALLSAPALGQSNSDPQDRPQTSEAKVPTSANDPMIIISGVSPEELAAIEKLRQLMTPAARRKRGFTLTETISAAISERLGARYSWGATGPTAFDCSGFVWSTFNSAGVMFERGSARALWTRFLPPMPEEEFKFGTLVFFSGLTHVGIVASEEGFYHASRHHGVVYSPFNDYWLSRIDGFRRVPLAIARK